MLSQKETSAQKTVVAVHTEGASYLKSSDRRGDAYAQEDESVKRPPMMKLKEEAVTLLEMMGTIMEIMSTLKTEEAIEGVFDFAKEKIMDAAREVILYPCVHRRFLEMLLKKSKLAAAIRASQANGTEKLYSEDVKVILKITHALNVETKEKVLGLKKQVAYITSELDSEREGRKAAVAVMRKMEGDIKEMEFALISQKDEKEDALKLVSKLKEEVENAVCVAEDTKDKLRAANQEAEREGKALNAVIRQLSDELSCAKRERLAAATERDGLAANLEAGEEKERRIFLLEAEVLQLKEELLISQKASKIEADELAAKLVVNINEDMMVEEVNMDDPIAEREPTLEKLDEQLPGKLDTGRLEEVEDKLFDSEMKTKKKSNLRRWNNKMLEDGQVVMKMPSGSGAANKIQAEVRENYERWNDKLSKLGETTLPEKDGNFRYRKKTTDKKDSAWQLKPADKGGGSFKRTRLDRWRS
ncbi:myosin heavy chain, embryonic smooth muscle isoform-like [Musca domestica]|uniref:Myosin heavy chain, embryonic smooth muscle isoform-like n=1 Tax=Musca domestica TaxID=7370 RepID=A0ABM3VQN1_MUSDO|nr:myosin heavy chain, embryonic smooth muscle isoform-like [Musca domestica]